MSALRGLLTLARRGRLLALGAVAALSLVVAAACSEHVDPMAPDTGNDVVVIEIRNFEFSQPELHIAAGTTVRWVNTTSNYHTVTPDGHSAWSQWQTAGMGESFEVTFDTQGSYPYYCNPHRALGMTGTVIVE